MLSTLSDTLHSLSPSRHSLLRRADRKSNVSFLLPTISIKTWYGFSSSPSYFWPFHHQESFGFKQASTKLVKIYTKEN